MYQCKYVNECVCAPMSMVYMLLQMCENMCVWSQMPVSTSVHVCVRVCKSACEHGVCAHGHLLTRVNVCARACVHISARKRGVYPHGCL